MTREQFSAIVKTIPHKPGVYKYFDENDKIIYVGKAKDLRKRVTSYFAKNITHQKTKRLVSLIHKLEFTIVETEKDAFLLESSLIKHFKPKFNIALKDDKGYPYIVIKKEEYPRVFVTRKKIKDSSTYLGPYTNVFALRELLEFIKQSLPIRSCNLPLTEESIKKNKFKACLEFQIGNCKAPCINAQSKSNYNWYVKQIEQILKGNMKEIIANYKTEMANFVENLEFEKAEIIRLKLEGLNDLKTKSTVVNHKIDNVDVCSILSNENYAVVNFMSIANGNIIHSKTIEVEKKLEETDDEILSFVIPTLREQISSSASEIIAPINFINTDASVTLPKIGDKQKLLNLSIQNTQYFLTEINKRRLLQLDKNEEYFENVLAEIKQYLKLDKLPRHIECFDNSNFQGAYPVAAMVCFKDGKPDKKNYRHFQIKTVEGINDFASMEEIIYRRYKRLLDEKQNLPNLVIIDGGKGQLGAALKSIKKLNLLGKITIVGLAKNIEELFFPGDNESIKLPFHSEALKLIRSVRDEVHRFGITFHRKTRSTGIIKNELQDIKGIGEQTANELLKAFKSINKIKTLSQREIASAIGTSKARIVWKYFNEEN